MLLMSPQALRARIFFATNLKCKKNYFTFDILHDSRTYLAEVLRLVDISESDQFVISNQVQMKSLTLPWRMALQRVQFQFLRGEEAPRA